MLYCYYIHRPWKRWIDIMKKHCAFNLDIVEVVRATANRESWEPCWSRHSVANRTDDDDEDDDYDAISTWRIYAMAYSVHNNFLCRSIWITGICEQPSCRSSKFKFIEFSIFNLYIDKVCSDSEPQIFCVCVFFVLCAAFGVINDDDTGARLLWRVSLVVYGGVRKWEVMRECNTRNSHCRAEHSKKVSSFPAGDGCLVTTTITMTRRRCLIINRKSAADARK